MTDEQRKCPYCHADEDGGRKALGMFFICADYFDGCYKLNTRTRYKSRKINYCFMCGRKLDLADDRKKGNL